MRLFIAVDPPATAAAAAARAIERLRRTGIEARWVDARQLHMTLHFLGDLEETRFEETCRAIDRACARLVPITVAWGGVGVFPDRVRPRTIWIGVTQGAGGVSRLRDALAEELSAVGLPLETRRYHPHLTLGRLHDRGRGEPAAARLLSGVLDGLADLAAGRARIDEVVLYRSRADAEGRVYEPLYRARLSGGEST